MSLWPELIITSPNLYSQHRCNKRSTATGMNTFTPNKIKSCIFVTGMYVARKWNFRILQLNK